MSGFGSTQSLTTAEAKLDRLAFIDSNGLLFTGAGRLVDRRQFSESLGIEASEASALGDSDLMYRSWLRWGASCATRISGDWAFAVWDPTKRELFLARDRSGNTALYYYAGHNFLVFSSSRRALLELNLFPPLMDELFLAQVLVSWPGYHDERTIHQKIKRLGPACCLVASSSRVEVRQYWRPEDTPEVLLPRHDYVPAFLEKFDRAVVDCLRGDNAVGAMLSGGLDSGSVVVTAARYLDTGRRLKAFTAVPGYATNPYTNGASRFGDEFPLAQDTVQSVRNVDLTAVDAVGLCPIDAIRRGLGVSMEPRHGAANMFWTMELRRRAAEEGCSVLLTGVAGNNGISWSGDMSSQPTLAQIRKSGLGGWLRRTLRRRAPQVIRRAVNRHKLQQNQWQDTAIHPAFAKRLDLAAHYLDYQEELARSPFLQRGFGINAGTSFVGAGQAEMGAAFGLDVRDPTADSRLLAFCYSIPDCIFIEPETLTNRWMIREAMKGRLPDSVRLNRRRGQQAADLVPRLRTSAVAVENALTEIDIGGAAEYVSVPALRKAWQRVLTEDTPASCLEAVTVLTRGIMAGLFVNGFGGGEW